MSKIYDKMFLKNENQIKYKQLNHISQTNKKNLKKGIGGLDMVTTYNISLLSAWRYWY